MRESVAIAKGSPGTLSKIVCSETIHARITLVLGFGDCIWASMVDRSALASTRLVSSSGICSIRDRKLATKFLNSSVSIPNLRVMSAQVCREEGIVTILLARERFILIGG